MHITVKFVATDNAVIVLSVAIAVTLMCTSLSQHSHYDCCLSTVTVSAVAVLRAQSLLQRCAHRCLTAVEILLRTALFIQSIFRNAILWFEQLKTSFEKIPVFTALIPFPLGMICLRKIPGPANYQIYLLCRLTNPRFRFIKLFHEWRKKNSKRERIPRDQ